MELFYIAIIAILFYNFLSSSQINLNALLIVLLVVYFIYSKNKKNNNYDEVVLDNEELDTDIHGSNWVGHKKTDYKYFNHQIMSFLESIQILSIYNYNEYKIMLKYLDEFFHIYYFPNYDLCKYHVDTLKLIMNKILDTLQSIIIRIPPEATDYTNLLNEKLTELENILTQYYNNFSSSCYKENTKNVNIFSHLDYTVDKQEAPNNTSPDNHYDVFN